MFTFGGPGGFQARYAGPRPRRPAQQTDGTGSPLLALLPMILLFAFALISIIPTLFSTPSDPDPGYTFEPTTDFNVPRDTWQKGVGYYVNQPQFDQSAVWQSVPDSRREQKNAAAFSQKMRQFERGVEAVYVQKLHNEVGHVNLLSHPLSPSLAPFFVWCGCGIDLTLSSATTLMR